MIHSDVVQGGTAERTTRSHDARVARVARRQFGIVTREQALCVGMTRSNIETRIASGRWERVHQGVFRIAGHPASWRQSLTAACMACGPGAVASHRSAAALWHLPGFDEGTVEVSTVTQRRQRPAVMTHTTALDPRDVTTIGGIAATRPVRTLIDLASISTVDQLEEALDDAVRRGLTTIDELRRRAFDESAGGRRGIMRLRRLLDVRTSGAAVPQSVFETRLLRLMRENRLPDPVAQYRVRADGTTAFVDFAFPDRMLAIEADGYRWHSGRQRWQRDLTRRNVLTSSGWRVLHVTWEDLRARPDDIAQRIRNALATGIR